MAAHSGILAWRTSMDRGAWQVAVSPRGCKEKDTTDWPGPAQHTTSCDFQCRWFQMPPPACLAVARWPAGNGGLRRGPF